MSAYRYIVLMRDGPAAQSRAAMAEIARELARRADAGWARAFRTEQLEVWEIPDGFGTLGFRRSVDPGAFVLGRIYRKPCLEPGGEDSNEAREGAAEAPPGQSDSLAREWWGTYVAFAPGAQGTSVFRDPSGGLPCHYFRRDGLTVFFSYLPDVRSLIGRKLSVRPAYTKAFALMPRLPKGVPGLNEVEQVLPAQELRFDGNSVQARFPWDPWEEASQNPIYDRDAAAAALRAAIMGCVRQLALPGGTVLHSLGGLDSAIVLAAYAASGRGTMHAFNGFTGAAAGDERRYARAAADFSGCRLTEVFLDPHRVDLESVLSWPPQPAPIAYFDCTGPAGGVYALAKSTGARALWNGVGGDNVFLQLADIVAALDAARSLRRPRALFRTALDAARYGGTSLGHTLWRMAMERAAPSSSSDYVLPLFTPRPRLRFLGAAIRDAGLPTEFLHPLLDPPPGAAKAKHYQVLVSCLFSIDYYDPWQHAAIVEKEAAFERVSPLLAQPVVETCLRIAPWLFIDGGMDRALARRAFSTMLSPVTLGRVSKSNPDALYDEVTRLNAPLIRDVLLGGVLVRDGILDRQALEDAFKPDGTITSAGTRVALDLFNWEAWTRSFDA